jgi:ABC-type dipeptide/oligopeptide/nickel transport system permease subunit
MERASPALDTFLQRPLTLLKLLTTFGRRQPLGGIGAIILLAIIVVAIIAPFVAPADPYELNLNDKYAPPGATVLDEETLEEKRFLLGTDQLGRDVLSRLMYGARISLYVGLISVGIGVSLGALIGIFSAYLGGKVDLLVQRMVDALMAFPAIILALVILAVLGPSLRNVIITLIILFIPGSCRIVRSQALVVKEMVYTDAARAIGSSNLRIILRHVLPNCMAPYIVFATANLGLAIIVEASLSFLGVGTPIDVPSWGGMLAVAGSKFIEVSPWLLIFPSIAISVAVFGFNLLGDALRDVLDPRLRGTS